MSRRLDAPMLDLPAFLNRIGAEVDLDLTSADTDSLLVDDLGIDSLAMIEIVIVLSDLGVTLPEALVPELRTIGDLFHYYETLSPRPAGTDEGSPSGQVLAT